MVIIIETPKVKRIRTSDLFVLHRPTESHLLLLKIRNHYGTHTWRLYEPKRVSDYSKALIISLRRTDTF